jgi:methylthioxylose transferase
LKESLSRRVVWCALLLASALSLLVAVCVARQSLIIGSRAGEWVYPYNAPFRLEALWIALLTTAIAAALLATESGVRAPSPLLLLWFVAGFVIQMLLRTLTPFTLAQMFASPGANSFYDVATHELASNVLRDFHALRAGWPIHAQSNTPGKIMLVYAFRFVTERLNVMAWLVLAVSNLGVFLTYWFTKDLLKDTRTALWAALLYLIVPAKLLFFPLLNTVTPVIVLLCACLLQRWLISGRALFAALLGASLYGLVFWEPLPLVMGLLFAALLGKALLQATVTWRTCVVHGLLALAGFTATYAAIWLLFGFDLASALREIGAHATAFNRESGRPYGLWVKQNLFDFVFGIGICQAVLVIVALGDGLFTTGERWRSPIVLLTVSLIAVLLVTDLLGVNRGEIVRLWIFLACFMQIPAAYVCARLDSRIAIGLVLGTTLLQDALGAAMIGFIVP